MRAFRFRQSPHKQKPSNGLKEALKPHSTGQVLLTQNRGGGAAGVYGDFASTQPYQSVESNSSAAAHQNISPAEHVPSTEAMLIANRSPAVGSSAAADVSLLATQPAQPLEDSPTGRTALQHAASKLTAAQETVNVRASQETAVRDKQACGIPHCSMPVSNASGAFQAQIAAQQTNAQQNNISNSMTKAQSPEDYARGSRLHVPASSPSTSCPSTATAVRQKSRLSMATNANDQLPNSSPQNQGRQLSTFEEAEEGDGWNEEDVIWGRIAADGRGTICGTRAELETRESLKVAVRSYLQQDLQAFSASIASFAQFAGLSEVKT